MIDGVLDTTVLLHSFRNYQPAVNWLNSHQHQRYGITTISWMEVMEGTTNKSHQSQTKSILDDFALIYVTIDDQAWAMKQLEHFQFSHHLEMNDCLIASVAYRLKVPLYTHNLKDMTPMLGSLAVKPYA